jgi:hypothetical protein
MENFFNYLNVAIGVSFIYMILSLLISEVQENITALFELRAVSLRSSLINLLEGKDKHDNPDQAGIMQALYNTSLLKSLNQGKKASKGPSYIPKEIFSAALLEVLKTRYQLDINNQDNIGDIANKIDNKIQEYQGQIPEQLDQSQLDQTPASTEVSTSSWSDSSLQSPTDYLNPTPLNPTPLDPTTGQGTVQSLPNKFGETPVSEEIGVSAWNDPSLEPSIVPLDMVVTPGNIQSTQSVPTPSYEEHINTLVDTNPAAQNNTSITNNTNAYNKDNGEENSDIYLLTNLSTLARRIQDQVDDKEAKLVEFQKGMADWFDQSMVRASGTYKRNAKGISFFLGLIVAILGNVDTINMVDRLYKNQSLSGTINQLADQVIASNPQSIATLNDPKTVTIQDKNAAIQPIKDNINVVIDQIAAFPIGWTLPRDANISPLAWISRLAGWFISAIALSMGAPFWFELLNKFINVRNAGQKPSTGDADTSKSQT